MTKAVVGIVHAGTQDRVTNRLASEANAAVHPGQSMQQFVEFLNDAAHYFGLTLDCSALFELNWKRSAQALQGCQLVLVGDPCMGEVVEIRLP